MTNEYLDKTGLQIYHNKVKQELTGVKSQLEDNQTQINSLNGNKVDKVIGKGLSTNDYDNLEKAEVAKVKDKASKAELEVERQRINNFTRLAEGSTTGDAELIDARVGADGKSYANVGDAIRITSNNLSRGIDDLNKDLSFLENDALSIESTVSIISDNKFDNIFDEPGKFDVSTGDAADAYTLNRSSKFHDIGDVFDGTIYVGFSGHTSSDEIKSYILLYTAKKTYVGYIFAQNIKQEKSINTFTKFYSSETSLSTYNIKYFRICKTASVDMKVYVSTVNPISPENIDFSYRFRKKFVSCGAIDRVKALVNRSNMFSGNVEKHTVNGFLDASDGYIKFDDGISQITDYVNVIPGEVIFYSGYGGSSAANACFYDENFVFISSITNSSSKPTPNVKEIVVPPNAYNAKFASRGNSDRHIPEVILKPKQSEMYTNGLTKKKWYACGDSFTQGAYIFGELNIPNKWITEGKYVGKLKSYPYYIGNRTNCDVFNIALAGSTLSYVPSQAKNYSFSSDFGAETPPFNNYKSVSSDADYITLWFGINDSGYKVPIGNDVDTTNVTFKGAYNIVLKYLLESCPKAKIGIIVSNNMPQAYVTATIEMAKRWGIPYLDLNSDDVPLMQGSLRNVCEEAKINAITKFALTPTNMHPNFYAHEFESKFIEQWLLGL